VTRKVDLAMYVQALPLYARNLGVLFPPLVAALIAIGLMYAGVWFFAASGGAGIGLVALLINIMYGFAFGISVIFADDAWRHGRGNLSSAWSDGRRKAGNILIAVIGFFFLTWVARYIGAMSGSSYVALALGALAVWAFIYSIPAAAIGGTPGGAALSASLQSARRQPLATAILVAICLIVWMGLTYYAIQWLPFDEIGNQIAVALLTAIALGYIALVVAKQYSDVAFRPYW
jgi:magnesium-transporting ATPase (P-type)